MARQIRSLTGLRGVAALAVVVHHVNVFVVGGAVHLRGQTFVDLFFVLSGYVISLAYLGDGARLSWSHFARARFARLYPLHFVTALAMAAAIAAIAYARVEPLDARFTPLSALRELLLLGAMPLVAARELWNYPAWSISVEWWTYFTVFPLIVLVRRRDAATTLGFGFLLLSVGVASGLYFFPERQVFVGWLAFLRAAVGFGAGWFVWECSRKPAAPVHAGLSRALLLVIAIAIYAAPALSGHDAWFLLPVFPLLIYALAGNDAAGGMLGGRVAVWLGEISYSLYLVHPLVLLGLGAIHESAPEMPQTQALLIYSFAGLSLSILLSTLSYRWLEKPARDWLSPRAPRRATSAVRNRQSLNTAHETPGHC